MILLQGPSAEGAHVVLLFGLGLIGSAVHRALQRHQPMTATHFSYDWQDAKTRSDQLETLECAVAEIAAQGIGQLDVVWTAGRSGFTSSKADMAREYDIVAQISALAQRLHDKIPRANHGFHLLSSAGGLYEGCLHCTSETAPLPKRPYGHGKLAQETLVRTLPETMRRCIYRPSSVYGYAPNGRVGLITALIGNGLKSRSTHIFGKVDTLRDYVSADDIGAFIAQQINARSKTDANTFFLVTGQAASMHQVVRLVENALGRALYLQFDPNPQNASDITFMQSALPPYWHPTTLNTSIAQLVMRMSGQ